MTDPVLLWLRRDLRLSDQAALTAAAGEGPVIPVYVLDDETPRHRRMGGASRWWLHHSLRSLDAGLRAKGSRLILRQGKSDEVLAELAKETGATRVHCLRHYEPWWRNAEKTVAKSLGLVCHDGNYLLPPGSVTTGAGQPYKIYTPFWRALNEHMPPAPGAPEPHIIPTPEHWPKSDHLSDWKLLPSKPDWAGGFGREWTPGEAGGAERLDHFIPKAAHYDIGRNLPAEESSSRLSPHLHFGEISPATVWHHSLKAEGDTTTFLKEIAWRDYAQNVILQFPDYGKTNGRPALDDLAWRTGAEADADLKAWKTGQTGYPIVDAGMRQLWTTGWMHNRVRMIAASFLIKHLLIDWRVGEQWFWDTLVDADYASNSVNWQWTAGTGVDSNMFVRIMAPLSQSEKFAAGDYIREWVPELAGLGDDAIHDPDAFGRRPAAYPAKIIGHREARERALAAVRQVK
ncbi:deoxyribodipyrimidine photo-lyase [Sphingomonas sp. So64.6b]|uniref:cryptochrome/photolyase family protein n=1 Tax=Sphingomonas sp. So64.6b TaxID=2997354 RepID=UPI0015FF9DF7|nr:deoxyribodipyrimidine photo-lyase [Sphingomonas sp. So64.6b]QNA83653.1 deoxyribodipyrimidine photo-lyase [Sphingomonas sp. So64.6b]